jgi:hypothetical protein
MTSWRLDPMEASTKPTPERIATLNELGFLWQVAKRTGSFFGADRKSWDVVPECASQLIGQANGREARTFTTLTCGVLLSILASCVLRQELFEELVEYNELMVRRWKP